MSANTYQEILSHFLELPPQEQTRLLAEIQAIAPPHTVEGRRSILELEGLGKELWEGVDVQKYLDEERASWDG
jgi:hypothetical protein